MPKMDFAALAAAKDRLAGLFRKDNGNRQLTVFGGLTEKGKAEAVERLVSESTPRGDFFVLILLSVMMATLGIFLDRTEVVIGSMLIAPLLYPIMGISMGVVMADYRLIVRSFLTVLKSAAIAVPAAALAALFIFAKSETFGLMTGEMTSRTAPGMTEAAVALIAGFAASLALVKPHLSAALPGVAISVSLLPPLSVIGIALARTDWQAASGAALLFLVNAACIVFGALVVFSLARIYTKQKVAERAVEAEDTKLEKGEA